MTNENRSGWSWKMRAAVIIGIFIAVGLLWHFAGLPHH